MSISTLVIWFHFMLLTAEKLLSAMGLLQLLISVIHIVFLGFIPSTYPLFSKYLTTTSFATEVESIP